MISLRDRFLNYAQPIDARLYSPADAVAHVVETQRLLEHLALQNNELKALCDANRGYLSLLCRHFEPAPTLAELYTLEGSALLQYLRGRNGASPIPSELADACELSRQTVLSLSSKSV